jgi:hypothetical protein
MLYLLMPATFKYRQRTFDVRLGVRKGIFKRVPNSSLGSKVYYAIKAMIFKE